MRKNKYFNSVKIGLVISFLIVILATVLGVGLTIFFGILSFSFTQKMHYLGDFLARIGSFSFTPLHSILLFAILNRLAERIVKKPLARKGLRLGYLFVVFPILFYFGMIFIIINYH